MQEKKKKNKSTMESVTESYREASPYLGLGIQFAASVLLMLFAGYKLDELLETSPVFTLILALFGAGAGLYQVIKSVNDINNRKNDK